MSGLIDKILRMYETPEGKMKLFLILFYISLGFLLFGYAVIIFFLL